MLDNWLSKTKIKEKVQKVVEKHFYGKLTANQSTLLGLIFGLLSALSIALTPYFSFIVELIILSVILTIISFMCDVIDGALARVEEPTIFGGILDIFCDRTVEISIIIALVSTDPENLVWPGLFSLGAMILCISMFLLIGSSLKEEEMKESEKIIYYRKGLMERSETLILLILIITLIEIRGILLWIFALLVFLTALLRLKDAYSLFKHREQKN